MIDRGPKCPVSFITAWPQVSLTIAWPLVSLPVAWPLVSWPTLDYWSLNPRFTIATFGPAWPPVSLARAWPLISLTIAWPLVSLTISCPWACDKLNCFREETNELGDPMSRGSNEPGIQWAWDPMSRGSNEPGIQWAWDPMSRGNIGMLPSAPFLKKNLFCYLRHSMCVILVEHGFSPLSIGRTLATFFLCSCSLRAVSAEMIRSQLQETLLTDRR